ncbi:hypothetical protein JHK84_055588 [Glycine max]|nr:hypothetical protein JHK84_055588 [Glycine max]
MDSPSLIQSVDFNLSYKASMTIFFGVDYADGTSEKVTAVYCVREEYSKMLNAEGEALKDSSGKSCDDDVKEQCEKKPRVAQNSTANLCGKQLLKQKKDDSESEEGSKENLHSCESLKRSSYKQSQPCRKAVMLDEIINYVQSLQQQVESHIGHEPIGGYGASINMPNPSTQFPPMPQVKTKE